jgi:protein-tyrosine-phosphatase
MDPAGWRPAQLKDVVRRGDLLIAVCDNAYERLPSEQRPRLHWSIPDPAPANTDAAFEAAYTELADRIDRLAPTLSPKTAATARSKP